MLDKDWVLNREKVIGMFNLHLQYYKLSKIK